MAGAQAGNAVARRSPLTLYSYEDLERAASGFAPESALGSGGSGTVYRADLGGGARRGTRGIKRMIVETAKNWRAGI